MNDYDSIIVFAKSQGWYVEDLGKHRRFISPTGATVTFPVSPSDWRGFRNMVAELRRQGLHVPRKRTPRKAAPVTAIGSVFETICNEAGVNLDVAPWPFIRQIIGHWRDDTWFDDDGMPISEEEWSVNAEFSERALIAASIVIGSRPEKVSLSQMWEQAVEAGQVSLTRLIQNRPTDKFLVTTMSALKYWGAVGDPSWTMPEKCVCGDTPKNLGEHVANMIQVGRGEHGPEGLREWIDPTEIRLILEDPDDKPDELVRLQEELVNVKLQKREVEENLSALRSKLRALV